MSRMRRMLAGALIAVAAMSTSGCSESGIGMSVPAGGARWGSGAAGPDVLVGGGPVYP